MFMSRITYEKCYTTTQFLKNVQQLKSTYPFITVKEIGASVLGQPIVELRMGNGDKKIHWNGAFHANEWITSPLLMKMIEEYAEAVEQGNSLLNVDARQLFESCTLSVVPMVNPDGVDLFMKGSSAAKEYKELVEELNKRHFNFTSWKANIRGVDLNNQFPANWDIEQKRKPQLPTFRDYPGNKPLSEPEAIALYHLTKYGNFHRVLAFHSQGEVIYWGYGNKEPASSKLTVEVFKEISGYEPIHTIDSHAGFKDWFIDAFKREGYTVETGKGINPLPWSTFDYQFEKIKGICVKSLEL